MLIKNNMIMDITFGKLAKIIIELKKEKLDKSQSPPS